MVLLIIKVLKYQEHTNLNVYLIMIIILFIFNF